jgi:hypothetical protein
LNDHHTVRFQNAPDLAEGRSGILQIGQNSDTRDRIERPLRERKVGEAALDKPPPWVAVPPPRLTQHLGGEVHLDD